MMKKYEKNIDLNIQKWCRPKILANTYRSEANPLHVDKCKLLFLRLLEIFVHKSDWDGDTGLWTELPLFFLDYRFVASSNTRYCTKVEQVKMVLKNAEIKKKSYCSAIRTTNGLILRRTVCWTFTLASKTC